MKKPWSLKGSTILYFSIFKNGQNINISYSSYIYIKFITNEIYHVLINYYLIFFFPIFFESQLYVPNLLFSLQQSLFD